MKSAELGTGTSKVEVLNISARGIWLYVKGREFFLSYRDFPWFKEARISELQNVSLLHGHHLRWNRLDVDLDVHSLEGLGRYPLIYK